MHAEIRQVDGLAFAARAGSNHWIPMDTVEESGGHAAASTPLEMLLMALGTCTSMDVVSILKKMQVRYDDYRVTLDADRAEEHPKVLTRIELTYTLVGEDIPEDKLKKAIDLSLERYCPINAMLRDKCQINYKYEIVEPGQ